MGLAMSGGAESPTDWRPPPPAPERLVSQGDKRLSFAAGILGLGVAALMLLVAVGGLIVDAVSGSGPVTAGVIGVALLAAFCVPFAVVWYRAAFIQYCTEWALYADGDLELVSHRRRYRTNVHDVREVDMHFGPQSGVGRLIYEGGRVTLPRSVAKPLVERLLLLNPDIVVT
jgi:hypothetical protein